MQQKMLGAAIADLRKARNMTQAQVAAHLHVTDKAVSKWEWDLSCPDVPLLPRLAALFDVSLDELMQARRPRCPRACSVLKPCCPPSLPPVLSPWA